MPFTPLHMGPGIAIKSVLQGSFSLMVFGWSQIIMDIQPLYGMLSGADYLHGVTHSYIGASVLAIFSALTGKYLSELGLFILGINKHWQIKIPWWVSFLSAFIGCYSHVLLDSIMHVDIQPFYPFDSENSLQLIISIESLHNFCLYSGIVGGLLYFAILGKHNIDRLERWK